MSCEGTSCKCSIRAASMDSLISALQSYIATLDKHAQVIDSLENAMRRVNAGVEAIRAAQATQNQITSNIFDLYSRLPCVAPSESNTPPHTHQEYAVTAGGPRNSGAHYWSRLMRILTEKRES